MIAKPHDAHKIRTLLRATFADQYESHCEQPRWRLWAYCQAHGVSYLEGAATIAAEMLSGEIEGDGVDRAWLICAALDLEEVTRWP